jgi:hypothetical protein
MCLCYVRYCPFCAHYGRSVERRCFSRADIPSSTTSGCNGWNAVIGPPWSLRHQHGAFPHPDFGA